MTQDTIPIIHPPRIGLPVMLSVPHAGRAYDPAVIARSTQGQRALETLEDPLVDRLMWRAFAAGIGGVVQPVPRAVIDCNRRPDEVDPAAIRHIAPLPVGPRAQHGLGIIASRTRRHGALWRQPIERDEFQRRLDRIYWPYHRAVETMLDQLAIDHGQALLLDMHSMPARRPGEARIVIGDRHGSSAASWLSQAAAGAFRDAGLTVALNDPYAGGAISERHGRPSDGRHALQIEIDRSLYLAADQRSPAATFDRLAAILSSIAVSLGEHLASRQWDVAAE
ncbi:N-formylglutamate amidohydrolase [Sphingomonas jaspsi]|uniref:N-formylglutamate amidohydrolase n=1 Tax=Sphingomonas jaspsi TaxID=392409 RepID=UPI0004B5EFEE|nr:N-formylglutamate amidohydrolase [Sphingomonas jaspsi]